MQYNIIKPRPHVADPRTARSQITKDGPVEVGVEMDAEEPAIGGFLGGIGSEFSFAASGIPSLKTRICGTGKDITHSKWEPWRRTGLRHMADPEKLDLGCIKIEKDVYSGGFRW